MPLPWPKDAKIIEFGATDGRLATQLIRAGCKQILCVVGSPARVERLVAANPLLERKVASSRERGRLRRNNADVLVLNGRTGLALARTRIVRHAEWVTIPLHWSFFTLLALLFGTLGWILRAYDRPRLVSFRDIPGRAAVAFRVRRRRPYASVRRFLPYGIGVEGFFARLNKLPSRYVVLRWFESLPEVAAGEDLDLLVDDQALEPVRELLDSGPGIQPVDLYSVTGLPGADYRSLPYYPPAIAEQLLAAACWHRNLCRVPSPEHYFLSLAYHALYHKGLRAGLPANSADGCTERSLEHDYALALQKLAAAADFHGEITMESLDAHLAARGWRPTHDMLSRLARYNPWLKRRLQNDSPANADDGLAVFLLRELAMSRGGIDRAVRLLERHGFTILHAALLPPRVADAVARAVRGGNWGRGPWKTSGGQPVAAIVAFDATPIRPNRRERKRFPFLANARLLCKEKIRDEFNRGLPADEQANVIHSSDNGREALEYVELACAEGLATIEGQIDELRRDFDDDPNVVATLTKSGRRAKIEVVQREGRLVVKKTFKPSMRRYWERERRAIRELAAKVPQAPQLLDDGDLWLLIPYYDDVLRYQRSSGKLLPRQVAKDAIAALRAVYQAGYALIDASVDNLLIDRREGLKLFDFEFCHKYETPPARFEESYDIVGVPADFQDDLPIQGCNTYERNWRPYIGLSLKSLLSDSAWLQHVKRSVYYLSHAYRYVPRLLRHYVRQAGSLGRGERVRRMKSDEPIRRDARQGDERKRAA